MRKILILGLLAITFATAQVHAQTNDGANTSANTPETLESKPQLQAFNSLKELIASGATISLLDAAGNVVATVNQDGTFKVTGDAALDAALNSAQTVRIDQTNSTITYQLATQKEGRPDNKMIFVVQTNPGEKTLTLPLVAALNREAAQQKRESHQEEKAQLKEEKEEEKANKSKEKEEPEKEKPEKEKVEKVEKETKPEKSNSEHGKGHKN